MQSCLAAATQKAAVLAAAVLASAPRPPFSPAHHGYRSRQHRRPLLLLPHNEFLTNKKGAKMFKKITNHPCLPDNNTHRFSYNPASPPPHKRLLFSPARQKSAMCRSSPPLPPPLLLNVLLWPMRNATLMPLSPPPLEILTSAQILANEGRIEQVKIENCATFGREDKVRFFTFDRTSPPKNNTHWSSSPTCDAPPQPVPSQFFEGCSKFGE